jgi:regulator of sigma E protease
LLNILKVAVGLGFVIFLHELGHFLLAKWNGVKVEKFSIGFGRSLFGFRRGETEYVLAAIPLGGFVKMLGEGPEDEANKSSDPRAYPNKSVGARMAIISAGVIMNLLLGLVCFVYAYGRGMDVRPALIGGVLAGSPAYEQGMRAGDEVVAIDGRRDIQFETLMLKVRLSAPGQVIRFDVKRPGQAGPIALDIEPRRDKGSSFPTIGVFPAASLVLARPSYLRPAGEEATPRGGAAVDLREKDRVVAVGPEGEAPVSVSDARELDRLLAEHRARPLVVHVERREGHGQARKVVGHEVMIPPTRVVDFGFRLAIEPVADVRAGSPAEKAGFRKGDRIVAVDGDDAFNPMRLPDRVYEHAGRPMTFRVERPSKGDGPARVEDLTVTPGDSPPWNEHEALYNQEVDVPGLGLSYPVRTRVVAVAPESPAARAGIKPGDLISSMALLPAKEDPPGEPADPTPITFTDDAPSWPFAFARLQILPARPVRLTVNGSKTPIEITPAPVDDWYLPYRGLAFEGLVRQLPPMSVRDALKRGFDDTIDNILTIYAMLRSLIQQRVGMKAMGGPVMIFQAAYGSAETSLTELIHFLGILSINLAVLNFLPIPPLDGGQMVFLIAEWIRGKPLPDSALIFVSWIGILMLLTLMVFVIFQDLSRLTVIQNLVRMVWGLIF